MIKDIWKGFKKHFIIQSKYKASYNMLIEQLGNLFPDANIYVTDASRKLIPKEELNKLLILNVFSLRRYVAEINDCEDYAFAFKALASQFQSDCAIALVFCYTPQGKHALNGFLDKFMRFHYIEPQTNKVFTNNKYKPYLIIM